MPGFEPSNNSSSSTAMIVFGWIYSARHRAGHNTSNRAGSSAMPQCCCRAAMLGDLKRSAMADNIIMMITDGEPGRGIDLELG